MADDGFHEIQLNGKQLVFLFMATTVVSVVIFLCGVLVGRGVRAQQDEVALSTSEVAPASATAAADAPPLAIAADGEAPAAPEELSYSRLLESPEQPAENLQVETPAPAAPRETPRADPPAEVQPAVAQADGFTIQVAALRERSEADALVRRLTAKGYSAYVLDPAPGAPAAVYRVRVGRYDRRVEAEQVVRRLEQEEQFKPWITR